MKSLALSLLLSGSLLFSVSAVAASNTCQEASHNASKAAQDYRNLAGKMKASCNSSYQECEQNRAQVATALQEVTLANEAMSVACVFVYPVLDDALPFTSATVMAAIDLLPESVAVPCAVVTGPLGEARIGCPSSWILNIPKSNVSISNASSTTFAFSGTINVSATIPIAFEFLSIGVGSCNLTVGTASGVPVSGTATFSSSLPGSYFNRLQLQVDSIGVDAISQSGCGIFSTVADFVRPLVEDMYVSVLRQTYTPPLLCGALGPELFGPCP